jgi:hypothetical protein
MLINCFITNSSSRFRLAAGPRGLLCVGPESFVWAELRCPKGSASLRPTSCCLLSIFSPLVFVFAASFFASFFFKKLAPRRSRRTLTAVNLARAAWRRRVRPTT